MLSSTENSGSRNNSWYFLNNGLVAGLTSDWSCSTCYKTDTNQPIVAHLNKHSIHRNCEVPWLLLHRTCSLCRAECDFTPILSRKERILFEIKILYRKFSNLTNKIHNYIGTSQTRFFTIGGTIAIGGLYFNSPLAFTIGIFLEAKGFEKLENYAAIKVNAYQKIVDHFKTQINNTEKLWILNLNQINTMNNQLSREKEFKRNGPIYIHEFPNAQKLLDNARINIHKLKKEIQKKTTLSGQNSLHLSILRKELSAFKTINSPNNEVCNYTISKVAKYVLTTIAMISGILWAINRT